MVVCDLMKLNFGNGIHDFTIRYSEGYWIGQKPTKKINDTIKGKHYGHKNHNQIIQMNKICSDEEGQHSHYLITFLILAGPLDRQLKLMLYN